jgi:DNA mismatch endonuclease (patch repair protein)
MKRGDPEWPQPTSAAASAIMRANGWRDTTPELVIRSLLHRRGLRFRKRLTIKLTGRRWTQPDIVLTRSRIAVFIDGCFWHACPAHGKTPKANADYWSPKLARNVARDADTNNQLTDLGWLVIRAWEHEDPAAVAVRVEHAHRSRCDETRRSRSSGP